MSLNTMAQRLVLEVPGIAVNYAVTLIQEAFAMICNSQMWSYQLQTSGWLTPGLLFPGGPGTSLGMITAVPYTNTVLGDATASAAWAAYIAGNNLPLFTQLQIRSPYYSLYNIIGYNAVGTGGADIGGADIGGADVGSGLIQLTLDRPWMEPGGSQAYMIYQAYFPVPVPDFKRFLWARDTTNSAPMDYFTYSQRDLAIIDPERTIFDDPEFFVPFQTDQRPGSATLGNMLIELWPGPMSVLPYTYGYLRQGQTLYKPNDTLPYPMTEDAVLWQAKANAYLWKEANKGDDMERGSGADWRFLAKAAEAQYLLKLKPIKDIDRDLVMLYFNRMQNSFPVSWDGFSNQNGSLNIGRM